MKVVFSTCECEWPVCLLSLYFFPWIIDTFNVQFLIQPFWLKWFCQSVACCREGLVHVTYNYNLLLYAPNGLSQHVDSCDTYVIVLYFVVLIPVIDWLFYILLSWYQWSTYLSHFVYLQASLLLFFLMIVFFKNSCTLFILLICL